MRCSLVTWTLSVSPVLASEPSFPLRCHLQRKWRDNVQQHCVLLGQTMLRSKQRPKKAPRVPSQQHSNWNSGRCFGTKQPKRPKNIVCACKECLQAGYDFPICSNFFLLMEFWCLDLFIPICIWIYLIFIWSRQGLRAPLTTMGCQKGLAWPGVWCFGWQVIPSPRRPRIHVIPS